MTVSKKKLFVVLAVALMLCVSGIVCTGFISGQSTSAAAESGIVHRTENGVEYDADGYVLVRPGGTYDSAKLLVIDSDGRWTGFANSGGATWPDSSLGKVHLVLPTKIKTIASGTSGQMGGITAGSFPYAKLSFDNEKESLFEVVEDASASIVKYDTVTDDHNNVHKDVRGGVNLGGAFDSTERLNEVIFPANGKHQTIGSFAFHNCSNTDPTLYTGLQHVEFRTDGGVTIGEGAFSRCYGLRAVDSNTSVSETATASSIGDYAFSQAHQIYRAVFSGNLISIGNYAFSCDSASGGGRNATLLSDLVIGNNVVSVGTKAFCASGLKRLIVPKPLTAAKIGANAFYDCSQLVEVENNSELTLEELRYNFAPVRDNAGNFLYSSVLHFTGNNTGETGSYMLRNADGVVFCVNTNRTDDLNDSVLYTHSRWYVAGLADYIERQYTKNAKLFKLPDELSNDMPRWITGFSSELWTDKFAQGQEYDYLDISGAPYKNTISNTVKEYDISQKAFGGWMPYLDLGNAVVNIGKGGLWAGTCSSRLSTIVIGEKVRTVGSYAFIFRNPSDLDGMRGLTVYMPSTYAEIKYDSNAFYYLNYSGDKLVVYKNKADYDASATKGIRPKFNNNEAGVYTYLMPVNFHVMEDGKEVASKSVEKVNGIGWNSTRGLYYPNLWSPDNSDTNALPNIDKNSFAAVKDEEAYSSTVWYTPTTDGSNKFNASMSRDALHSAIVGDSRKSASLELYANKVKAPTLRDLTYTYDSDKSYTLAQVVEAAGNSANGDYNISLTQYLDTSGTDKTAAVNSVHSAGTYNIAVALNSKWGVWANADDHSMTVTVNKAKINLADNDVLSWDAFDVSDPSVSTPVGLLSGTLYVLGQSNVSLQPNGGTETNVVSSYVRYFENRSVSLRVHPHANFGVTKYDYAEEVVLVGAYDTQATVQINESDKNNYEFSNEPVVGDTRNFGVRVVLAADGTATVTKTWYIVQASNWLTVFVEGSVPNEDSPEYTLSNSLTSSWTYGSAVTFNTPDLVHGDKNNIKFTLTRNGELAGDADKIDVWNADGNASVFGDYFNKSMPAGDYVLTLEVESLAVSGTTYPSIERVYRFKVEEREFTQEEKEIVENAIKGIAFEYLHDGEAHLWEGKYGALVNKDEQAAARFVALEKLLGENGTRADGTAWHVTPTGVWRKYPELYETVKFTYNLYRMQNNNYVSESYFAQEGNALLKSVGDYTVYYQFSAPSYVSLVNEASDARRESYFNVIVYRKLAVPQFSTELTYTGARNTPYIAGSDYYTIEWSETDDYIHARTRVGDAYQNIEHEIVLRSYDKNLYRWDIESVSETLAPFVRLDSENGANLILTYHITPAENRWTTSPRIVTWRWNGFDKEVNRVIAASYYGNNTIEFALEKSNRSGSYVRISFENDKGETVTRFALDDDGALPSWVASALEGNGQDAGNYRLVAFVPETGDYMGLNESDQPFEFSISKATNTWVKTPNVMTWGYNLFKASENTFAGLPTYFDEKNPLHFAVLAANGSSLGKSLNGYSLDDFTFTVDEDGVYVANFDIEKLLKELPAGFYLLRAWMDGTDNYEAIPQTGLTFEVRMANNAWIKTPSMTGWQYRAYSEEHNFIKGELQFETEITYYVFSGSIPAANEDGTYPVTANDMKFTSISDAETFLLEREAGTYWFLATAKGNANFNSLDARASFIISPNTTNAWKIIPSVTGWIYASGGTHVTAGEATFGTPLYTVYEADGKTVATVVFDGEDKRLENIEFENDGNPSLSLNALLNLLDSGSYRLSIVSKDGNKAQDKINFVAATLTLDFKIEKAPNEWATGEDGAQKKPSISGWTWSEQAAEPNLGVIKFESDLASLSYIFRKADSNGTLGDIVGSPEDAGLYAMVVTAAETKNYLPLIETVYFQIKQFENGWYNNVEPEKTLSWTYGDAINANWKILTASAKKGDVEFSIVGDRLNAAVSATKETLADELRKLGAGTYSVTATVKGSAQTFSDLTANTSITVEKAMLGWKDGKAPADISWAWDASGDDENKKSFALPEVVGVKENETVSVTYTLTYTSAKGVASVERTYTQAQINDLYKYITDNTVFAHAGKYAIAINATDLNYFDFGGSETVSVITAQNGWNNNAPLEKEEGEYSNFSEDLFRLPTPKHGTSVRFELRDGGSTVNFATKTALYEHLRYKDAETYNVYTIVDAESDYLDYSSYETKTEFKIKGISRSWSNSGAWQKTYAVDYGTALSVVVPYMDIIIDEGAKVSYTVTRKSLMSESSVPTEFGTYEAYTDVLNALNKAGLNAGIYTITAKYDSGNKNIASLEEVITATVRRIVSAWAEGTVPPVTKGYNYGGVTLANPVPEAEEATVVYKVNGTLIHVGAGTDYPTIVDYLNKQPVGTYEVEFSVENSENYTALVSKSTIIITQAPNGWQSGTAPSSSVSMQRNGDASVVMKAPVSLHGDVIVTISGSSTNLSFTNPTDEQLANAFAGLAAGTYSIVSSVTETPNYAGISAPTRLDVLLRSNEFSPAPSSSLIRTWTTSGVSIGDLPSASLNDGTMTITVTVVGEQTTAPMQFTKTSFATWLAGGENGVQAKVYSITYAVAATADDAGVTANTLLTVNKAANNWNAQTPSGSYYWTFGAYDKNFVFTADSGTPTYTIDGETVTGSLSDALNTLPVGKHILRAYIAESTNYSETETRVVELSVTRGENGWQTELNIGGWTWDLNLTDAAWTTKWQAPVPQKGDSVNITVTDKYGETEFTFALKYSLSDGVKVVLNEADLKAALRALNAGDYTITAQIPESDNWGGSSEAQKTFTVAPNANDWLGGAPVVQGWTYSRPRNLPQLQGVKYGTLSDVRYTYYYVKDSDGNAVSAEIANTPVTEFDKAGTYKFVAEVDASAQGNYPKLIYDEGSFVVSRADTDWQVLPLVKGWTWNEFDANINLFMGSASSGGKVTFDISRNGKTVATGLEPDKNGVIIDNGAIKDLLAGEYTFEVHVAATPNYNARTASGTFKVAPAANRWLTFPRVDMWAVNLWSNDNIPTARARYGVATLTITDMSGEHVYLTVRYDQNGNMVGELIKTGVEELEGGNYLLRGMVTDIEGKYEGLNDSVVIEVFLSSEKRPDNHWVVYPKISDWTAGDNTAPAIDQAEIYRGEVEKTFYHVTESGLAEVPKSEMNAKGYPTLPGDYVLKVKAINSENGVVIEYDTREEILEFTINKRNIVWTVSPNIVDWQLNGAPSEPVAQFNFMNEADSTLTILYRQTKTADGEPIDGELVPERPSTPGEYEMVVTATAKYCDNRVARISFKVSLAKNEWIDIPVIEEWSEAEAPKDPLGKAQKGDVVYVYKTLNGVILNEKPTKEGTYILCATVKLEGYEDLYNEFTFTITPQFNTTLLAVDISLACVLCVLTVVVIVFAIRRYKENA